VARLDATAAAYVENNQFIRPVTFIFMDFVGDPVRCNDAGFNIDISGQADANLNGTYLGVTAKIAELSPIRVGAGGSDTVTAKLSGIKGLDDDTLNLIGDQTKWKGRLVQVWRIVWDQNNAAQGSYQHYYTGYMTDCFIGGDVDSQFIEVSIENYLAAYVSPSNATYLNQADFDPGDASGGTTVALPNSGGGGHNGVQIISNPYRSGGGSTFANREGGGIGSTVRER
jgi:hypothetical protein